MFNFSTIFRTSKFPPVPARARGNQPLGNRRCWQRALCPGRLHWPNLERLNSFLFPPHSHRTGRHHRIECLEPRLALTATPSGSEFLVNDFVPGAQATTAGVPAVMVSSVNHVVVFDGRGLSDQQGVFATVSDTTESDTAESTTSFRVPANPRGEQYGATVAGDAAGNFVVAWAGRGAGDKQGIFFRRFDATGTPQGDEVLVNTTTGGRQTNPALAMAADGSFAVAWSGAGEDDASGVFLRLFDAAGTPQGAQQRINTTTLNHQQDPALAFDAAGNLVAAWSSRQQDGSDWGVYGQRFSATGEAVGDEFAWNATTQDSQQAAALAADPTGGIVAAWQSREQDGDGWGIVARQLAADGTTLTDEIVLNSTTVGQQRDVQLAIAEDGQWLATWSTTDNADMEIAARTFLANGTADSDDFIVNTTAGANSGEQAAPSIDVAATEALIVWSGAGTVDTRGTYAQALEVVLVDDGPPQAPVVDDIADQVADVNTQFEITVTATDPNQRDLLSFALDPEDAPATATLEQVDNNTAIIRWTPTPLEANQDFLFRVIVTDNSADLLSDTEDFRITVGDSAPADLVGFAQALTDANALFFGAAWDQSTTDQKELFADGGQFLPFVEITNADQTPNALAEARDIALADMPVWDFADDTRLIGVQSLQMLAATAGVTIPASSQPSLAPLPNETLLVGSPWHIPLDGYDPNGEPLSYSVVTDNSGVTGEILSGNRSARINVAGYGDLVFELFEQRAGRATDRFIELAEDDFYEDVIFHRVINNFVIQGGDPTGTGFGGSELGDFDDQFHVDLQHNRTGLLSYAKSSDDTNDSQFFVTESNGPAQANLRNLDFNHSIFGILVEGEQNRAAISDTALSDSRPINDVVMEDVEIFTDNENATLLLKAAPGTSGPVNVTVTVTDLANNTFERTFTVNVANDNDAIGAPTNGRPFLGDIGPVTIPAGTPAQIQLTATDVEGDGFVFEAAEPDFNPVPYTFDLSDTGLLTVTPPAGFTGTMEIEARVRREVVINNNEDPDFQLIRIEVI